VILYLDSSALVKRYVEERGTAEVAGAIAGAEIFATSEVSRAEISAALAKAIRTGALEADQASVARATVHRDWAMLVRVQLTEAVVARADDLAWDLGLRGYDAVQLACATAWKEGLQSEVTIATFDRQLWNAARQRGFPVLPASITPFLDTTG
jgi:uncharacterized protein